MTDNVDQKDIFYKTYPELDTPIHREFYEGWTPGSENEGLDENDLAILLPIDPKALGSLKIESTYPGDDYEKRDFSVMASDLIGENYPYFLDSKKNKASILILSKDEIKDIHSLITQLREKSIDRSIPCYLDKESNIMVMYIGTNISKYEIHHGKEAGTHRDTYTGVVLARALAKSQDNDSNRVIIQSPNELTDGRVLSLDLSTKSNRLVLNYKDQTLDEEMGNFLKDLGIISIKEYAAYLRDIRSSGEYTHLSIQELLEKLARHEVPMDQIVDSLTSTFDRFFREAYKNEGNDNIIFSTGIFSGETDKYYHRDNFASNENECRLAYETYAELLNQRESIPTSVIVFEMFRDPLDRVPNYLFIVGSNHPDVYHFYEMVGTSGKIGFAKAKAVAELDAALSIDIGNMSESNLGRNILPLHLSITGMGSRKTAISRRKSPNFVEDVGGLKRLISNFNTKYSLTVGDSELFTLDSTLF